MSILVRFAFGRVGNGREVTKGRRQIVSVNQLCVRRVGEMALVLEATAYNFFNEFPESQKSYVLHTGYVYLTVANEVT